MKNKMEQKSDFFETCGFRILGAIRRITRAVDIHSRKLHTEFHVTTPQMICIYELYRNEGMTLSRLSKAVNLGLSTVNGIVDRLELKGLLTRQRSFEDRRKVLLHLTETGRHLTQQAPSLLQDRLADALQNLPELEQITIAMSLERIVSLMEAQHIDASPNLLGSGDIQGTETNQTSTPDTPENPPPDKAAA